MVKAKKLPSGKWNCYVYSHTDEKGKRHYASFTAETKAEAQRLALEFQCNKNQESSPQEITVKKALDNYIASKTNDLSPSTINGYKKQLKHYDKLANIRVGALNSVDLQNFVNDISAKVSPKTVSNIYSLLLSSIRQYSDRNFRVTLPQKKNPERNIPTDADVKSLIENANPKLKLAIILGSQGLRRGEIASLKFKDILSDFNAIYIHSDLVKGDEGWVYKEIPKTSSSTRKVVLPKQIIDMLLEQKTEDKTDDDYIIGLIPSSITTNFINLRDRLGMKCRFHDLRHYSASILHSIGVPDVYIMERGGWSSDNVLKSIYRNSLSDKSVHFTNIANNYFEDNVLDKKANQK